MEIKGETEAKDDITQSTFEGTSENLGNTNFTTTSSKR